MSTIEYLKEKIEEFTADCIDDSEECAMWAVDEGVEIMRELLFYKENCSCIKEEAGQIRVKETANVN